MTRDPKVTELHPKTADSVVRRALYDGIRAMSFQPPHGKGLDQSGTEIDVRNGRVHAARPLDVIWQRAHAAGVPCFGEGGAMQIVDRLRDAVLAMWGERVTLDVQAASEAESQPDAMLDCLQARRQDQLSRPELQRAAALADETSHRARVYADACRARLAEMDAAEQAARKRLRSA